MTFRTFKTPKHHGYNVGFSNLNQNLIACATSQNYGLSGPGALLIFDQSEVGLSAIQTFIWTDGLFDLSWNAKNHNILSSGSGDGSIQVWNLMEKQGLVTVLKKHSKEVSSVDWNKCGNEHLMISSSWDGTTQLWDPELSAFINTYHSNDRVYDVSWSPHISTVFASVSGDGGLSIWDINSPSKLAEISAHSVEVLSCSWNYFKQEIIVTSSVDGLIKGWDIRIPDCPIFQLLGHQYAVRKVKCSPHKESLIASCSYDYNTMIWDWDYPLPQHRFENHTEFVYGLDFNPGVPGQLADCGWDEQLNIYMLP